MPKISDLPADTAPATDDLIVVHDVDAARTESVTVANLAASSAFSETYAPLTEEIFVSVGQMAATFGSPTYADVASDSTRYAGFPDGATALVGGHLTFPPEWTAFNVKPLWFNVSSGSGDVVWQFRFSAITEGAALSSTTSGTVTSTAGANLVPVLPTIGAGTKAVPASKRISFAIARLGADGADTLANDAGLIGVVFTKA